MTDPKCTWTEDVDGVWVTHCGKNFILNYGSPSENNAKYCVYCGKLIEEVACDE